MSKPFLSLWITCFSVLYAGQNISVAIIDIEGRGISQIEAASLTDRLRTAIVQTTDLTVVERSQMQQILAEQDFQLTGCTTDECVVEIGKIIGVQYIITGSIGKIGTIFNIDIRIIDVETARIQASVSRDYTGDIEGLLHQMRYSAYQIDQIITNPELKLDSGSDFQPSPQQLPISESGARVLKSMNTQRLERLVDVLSIVGAVVYSTFAAEMVSGSGNSYETLIGAGAFVGGYIMTKKFFTWLLLPQPESESP